MDVEVKILSKLTDKVFSLQLTPTSTVYQLKTKGRFSPTGFLTYL
jgi:hypothetical protein